MESTKKWDEDLFVGKSLESVNLAQLRGNNYRLSSATSARTKQPNNFMGSIKINDPS